MTMTKPRFNQSGPSLVVPTDPSIGKADDWDEQYANIERFQIIRRVMPPVSVRPMPFRTIRQYAMMASLGVDIETLDDGRLYGSIPGFTGVWAVGASRDELFKELEESVYGWALLKIKDEDRDLPIISGIDLNRL